MSERELADRQEKLQALGEIIVKRHERLSASQPQPQTGDQSALNFGRYLQASRKNAELSLDQLAQKAHLSMATLLALEQGLFWPKDIHSKWLTNLAQALEEDVEDFMLMLGCRVGQDRLTFSSILKATLPRLASSNYQSRSRSKRWQWGRISALSSAVIICFTLATLMNYLLFFPSSNSEEMDAFINVSTEQRLNMVKAETQLQIIYMPTNRTKSRIPMY